MLIKGKIEKQGDTFIVHDPSMPAFDDYLSDLMVMFERYPTENDEQLHNVRVAMELLDKLEKVASRLPKVPRKK